MDRLDVLDVNIIIRIIQETLYQVMSPRYLPLRFDTSYYGTSKHPTYIPLIILLYHLQHGVHERLGNPEKPLDVLDVNTTTRITQETLYQPSN